MPFGRLHEEAAGDGKLLALSDAAWRMWGMGLIYCQKNLTDGFIPEHAIHTFGVRAPNKTKIAEELCTPQTAGKAAVWAAVDGGFQVHDFLQWNDSRVVVLEKRAEGKDRVRRYRERMANPGNALPAAFPNTLHPSEHSSERDELQNAHPVVRGSEVLVFAGKGSGGNQSGGAMAGALPREHLAHALCDETFSRCVPKAVHAKLVNALAPKHQGNRDAANVALRAWYPTVWATLAADCVVGDAFKFWQEHFDAAFASKTSAVSSPGSTGRTGAAPAGKYAAVTQGLS